jgi:tetratricopeptide (TPR) repeat protein
LGDYPRAIDHHQQSLAIAREIGDRIAEGASLGNLGNCYHSLGNYPRAIDHHQQSLAIAREIGDRIAEGASLGNLGLCYSSLGDYPRAIDHHEQALAIARETGDQYCESTVLVGLGDVSRDTGKLPQAFEHYRNAIEIADATDNRQNQHEARFALALAQLYAGELAAACEAIDGARERDYPKNTAAAWAATGIIRLRHGETVAAGEAFQRGLAEADGLLALSGQNLSALDTKGLALSGLALCEDQRHLTAAAEAFGAAREITRAKGVVASLLNQFDALARADEKGVLKSVRAAAAGE